MRYRRQRQSYRQPEHRFEHSIRVKLGLVANKAPAASPPTSIPRRVTPLLLAAWLQAPRRFIIALWLLEVIPTLLPAASSAVITPAAVKVFPVPGGPWMIRDPPDIDAVMRTAASSGDSPAFCSGLAGGTRFNSAAAGAWRAFDNCPDATSQSAMGISPDGTYSSLISEPFFGKAPPHFAIQTLLSNLQLQFAIR